MAHCRKGADTGKHRFCQELNIHEGEVTRIDLLVCTFLGVSKTSANRQSAVAKRQEWVQPGSVVVDEDVEVVQGQQAIGRLLSHFPPRDLDASRGYGVFGFYSSTAGNDSNVCSAAALNATRVRGRITTNMWSRGRRAGVQRGKDCQGTASARLSMGSSYETTQRQTR